MKNKNFNPNLASDPFRWIPQGLFYDLWDPANETTINGKPVNHYVSGYSNQQLFSSFQSTIYTLEDYRSRLLQTISNPTSGEISGLFSQYHY